MTTPTTNLLGKKVRVRTSANWLYSGLVVDEDTNSVSIAESKMKEKVILFRQHIVALEVIE